MTQEEKDIIHKDACGRIIYKPYAAYEFEGELIKVQITGMDGDEPTSPFYGYSFDTWGHIPHDNVKLYLRSLSSMTEKEQVVYEQLIKDVHYKPRVSTCGKLISWLKENHFDYNYLIDKGLALEAPEDMYLQE